MPQQRRIAFATIVSWLSRSTGIVTGIALLPVLYRHLGDEELGVWLLLGQSLAALGILDLGFAPVLARQIARTSGQYAVTPAMARTDQANVAISDLFFSGQLVLAVLGLIVGLLAWTAGLFYLRSLSLTSISWQTAVLAWTLLCIGQAGTVWTNSWTSLLDGLGQIGWETLITTVVSLSTVGLQIIAVIRGGGLVELAAIQLGALIVSRLVFSRMVRHFAPDIIRHRGRWNRSAVQSLASPAFAFWLTTVGSVLLYQTDQLFVPLLSGASALPAYRASYLLFLNLQMVAVAVSVSGAPMISQYWAAGRKEDVLRFVERSLRLAMIIMSCGVAALAITGEELVALWLGPNRFGGYTLLTLFAVMMIAEAHTFALGWLVRCTGHEVFGHASLLSGSLKLILSYLLIRPLGLPGLAVGTLLAQVVTNHWYVPWRGLPLLGLTLRMHVRRVLLPSAAVLVTALALASSVRTLADSAPIWLRCLLVLATCGLVLLVSGWFLILSGGDRAKLSGRWQRANA